MSIAVGYDGGESAERALLAAIALAKDLDEELLIVCALAVASGLDEEYEVVDDVARAHLEPCVASGVQTARIAGVRATAVFVDDEPVEALHTAVLQHGSRMVVVGYGAAGRLRAALFGSIAPQLIDLKHVPVLVVP